MTWKLVALGCWIALLFCTAPLLLSERLFKVARHIDALVVATLLAGIATIWAVLI